jgi:hypothetical protein
MSRAPRDSTVIRRELEGVLQSAGYTKGPRLMQASFLLSGKAKKCDVLLGSVSPQGWDSETVNVISRGADQKFFFYRGSIYHDQPKMMTLRDYIISNSLSNLGFPRKTPPVLVVIAWGSCDLRSLKLSEVSGA